MNNIVSMTEISLKTLIRECKKKDISDEELYNKFCFRNRENIKALFTYHKFNNDFVDYLSVYTDGEHVVGSIRPSYWYFLYTLNKLLNISGTGFIRDDEDLTYKMQVKIIDLKRVGNFYALYRQFPELYKEYVEGKKYIEKVKKMPHKTEKEKAKQDIYIKYYYAGAMKPSIEGFRKTQATFLDRMVTDRKKYKEVCYYEKLDDLISFYFDIDKIAMYVAYNYLLECGRTTDRDIIKQYYHLLKKYKESNYDKNVSLTTDDGVLINWESIQKGMDDVYHELNKEAYADWVLIPSGKDKKVKGTSSPRIKKLNRDEVEKLRQIGERKNSYYEKTPYSVKVMGLKKYKGYMGYIYPNGEVILDREYDKAHVSSAKGNAVYHIHAQDFNLLSKLDKTTLRNHPKVNRLIHAGNWERKLNDIIYCEGTEEAKEEAKKLVRALKKSGK